MKDAFHPYEKRFSMGKCYSNSQALKAQDESLCSVV